jgi:hypothetical protein
VSKRWLLVPALIGLVFVWVVPAWAFSISFLEPISETAIIVVSTDFLNPFVGVGPEGAGVIASDGPGVFVGAPIVTASVGLLEPGTLQVSDILSISIVSPGGVIQVQATFQSDFGESALSPPPGGFTSTLIENGLPQVAFSTSLPLVGGGSFDLTVTTQSDLEPVPEPITMFLGGTGLISLAYAGRRRLFGR